LYFHGSQFSPLFPYLEKKKKKLPPTLDVSEGRRQHHPADVKAIPLEKIDAYVRTQEIISYIYRTK